MGCFFYYSSSPVLFSFNRTLKFTGNNFSFTAIKYEMPRIKQQFFQAFKNQLTIFPGRWSVYPLL